MANPAFRRGTSVAEYLAIDASSRERYEYWQGAVLLMAGGTPRHNKISLNLGVALHVRLRGSGCDTLSGDQRIYTPDGLYSYADVSVFCGGVTLTSDPQPTANNPSMLGEVLSTSTRTYDRGDKRELYCAIPSLRDLLLVEQDEVLVEHWYRTNDRFEMRVWRGMDAVIPLVGCGVSVPLAEIYEGIPFPEVPDPS